VKIQIWNQHPIVPLRVICLCFSKPFLYFHTLRQ
jgi:hypothetical protein